MASATKAEMLAFVHLELKIWRVVLKRKNSDARSRAIVSDVTKYVWLTRLTGEEGKVILRFDVIKYTGAAC